MSKEPTHLLWIDLESTGLDLAADEIIEVGVIITDLALRDLGEFHSIVVPTENGAKRLEANEFVRHMHEENGLRKELATAKLFGSRLDVDTVEQQILDTIDDLGLAGATFHIAGSGVAAFDQPMIKRLMPRIAERLHYAPIDIGIMRRFYKMTIGTDLVAVNNDKTHRSIDDVRCHLAEARAFRQLFQAAHIAASGVVSSSTAAS